MIVLPSKFKVPYWMVMSTSRTLVSELSEIGFSKQLAHGDGVSVESSGVVDSIGFDSVVVDSLGFVSSVVVSDVGA